MREISRLALVCSLSLFQGYDLTCDISTWNQKKGSFREKWRRYMRLKAAPKFYYVNVALVLYITIFVCIKLYLQYVHETNLQRLHQTMSRSGINITIGERSKEFRALGPEAKTNVAELGDEFATRALVAHSWLNSIGSSHLEWAFVPQNTHLCCWLVTVVLIVIAPVYLKFNELVYFSWARWLLDEAGECKQRAQSTLVEIDLLEKTMLLSAQIKSRKARQAYKKYYLTAAPRQAGCLPHRRLSTRPGATEKITNNSRIANMMDRMQAEEMDNLLGHLHENHQAAIEQLRENALRGQLNPLGVSRVHHFKLALLTLVSLVGLTIYELTLVYVAHNFSIEVLAKNDKQDESRSFWDFQVLFFMTYVVLIRFITATPLATLIFPIVYDQMKTIKELKQFILKTISRSEQRYGKLVDSLSSVDADGANLENTSGKSVTTTTNLIKAIEQDLLIIIVQYRLFIREYKLAMRPFSFFGNIFLWVGLWNAFLGCSHCPYLLPELKPMSVAYGYATMVPGLCYLMPLCQLHQNCESVYKLLYSLNSQATHFEQVVPTELQSFTLKFTNSLFRRELIEPEQAMSKFTIQVFSLNVTKLTLLRVTFWVTLIVIPMLNHSSKSDDDLISNLLRDSLGIFEQE